MKYFAYGSNMNPQRLKDRKVSFSKREPAIMKDHELFFNKQASRNPKEGYANFAPKEGKYVEGALYEVYEEAIQELDRCEGYPKHYDRKIIKVHTTNGDEIDALVYIAQPDKVKDV